MSIWTHVAGIIRIDAIRLLNENASEPDWDKIFGKQLLFEDLLSGKRSNHAMPIGSEGTIHRTVWVNPEKSHSAAYTISFWGDLRCYGKDNVPEFISWLNESLSKKNFEFYMFFGVRQGFFQLWCEDQDEVINIEISTDEECNTIVSII